MATLEWTSQDPNLFSMVLVNIEDWGPKTYFSFAEVLAHGFSLEVVIVSLATTIDEHVTGIIFLIIPPPTEKGHAETRFFWQTAYICRKTTGLRVQCLLQSKKLLMLSLETSLNDLEQAFFPFHTAGARSLNIRRYLQGDTHP